MPTRQRDILRAIIAGVHTIRALAEHLGVSKPTICRHVDSLVDARFARRVPDPEDGRSVLIQVLAAGRRRGERTSGGGRESKGAKRAGERRREWGRGAAVSRRLCLHAPSAPPSRAKSRRRCSGAAGRRVRIGNKIKKPSSARNQMAVVG